MLGEAAPPKSQCSAPSAALNFAVTKRREKRRQGSAQRSVKSQINGADGTSSVAATSSELLVTLSAFFFNFFAPQLQNDFIAPLQSRKNCNFQVPEVRAAPNVYFTIEFRWVEIKSRLKADPTLSWFSLRKQCFSSFFQLLMNDECDQNNQWLSKNFNHWLEFDNNYGVKKQMAKKFLIIAKLHFQTKIVYFDWNQNVSFLTYLVICKLIFCSSS